MRTTVRLDGALLADAKKLAADTGRTLTAVIEDALRETLSRRTTVSAPRAKSPLPVFKGRGLRPGVDLDSSAALLETMEEQR
jgi:hypothetical protein